MKALRTAAVQVDTGSFFAVVMVAAIAAITVTIVPKRFAPPVVVLELILGILIGPHVLGLAHVDDFTKFFSNLGLGMLFFFAGYEIDFERIRASRSSSAAGAGFSRSGSPSGSAASSPGGGSSSPSSTPAPRWRPPRSAP